MEDPNALEKAVLEKLFAGDHPALRALLQQAMAAKVVSRKVTGAGFFTEFALPDTVPVAVVSASKIQFGDVGAKIPGLDYGAGFLAYIEGGKLTMLEGYSYEEKWPESVKAFEVHYLEPTRKTLEKTFGPV